jgi:hypothetical protein
MEKAEKWQQNKEKAAPAAAVGPAFSLFLLS